MTQDLPARIEDLVSVVGTDAFGPAMFQLFDSVVGIDHCTVFTGSDATPLACVAEARSQDALLRVRNLAKSYVGRSHATDPIWTDLATDDSDEIRAFILDPRMIPDADYRREYYTSPGIQQELAVTGRLDGERFYVAFYRERGRPAFETATLDLLGGKERLLLRMAQRQSTYTRRLSPPTAPATPPSREALLARICTTLMRDEASITPREAEVCASIVLGYTVLGISMNLGISVNTVATHRKRAYAKLRISSQNELFGRYFRLIESELGACPPMEV